MIVWKKAFLLCTSLITIQIFSADLFSFKNYLSIEKVLPTKVGGFQMSWNTLNLHFCYKIRGPLKLSKRKNVLKFEEGWDELKGKKLFQQAIQ